MSTKSKALRRAVRISLITACLSLTACAGLSTVWIFQMQMQYVTPQDVPAAAEPAKPTASGVRL